MIRSAVARIIDHTTTQRSVASIGCLAVTFVQSGRQPARWNARPDGRADSLLNCLNAKSLKVLKVIVHGLEFVEGVALPIPNLSHDPKRVPSPV